PRPMKRFTERIVSNGRSPAICRARVPTTTSPSGRNVTADGSSRSPLAGSARTRGPSSVRTATRLFVVPRSMPTIRPTCFLSSEGGLEVAQERRQVRDLREPPLELREIAIAVPRGIARFELVRLPPEPIREPVVQRVHLVPHRLRRRPAPRRRAQLLEL